MNTNFTCASLYSGCSGSDLGFSEHFDIKLAVEIDPYACATYERNFGVKPLQVPVAKLIGTKIAHYDIIIGGPPCQSFSNARSNGVGFRDCSGMHNIIDFQKFVGIHEPILFIMENAPTLLEPSMSSILKKCMDFPKYNVNAYCIDAQECGAPQHRERTFLLGSRKDIPIHFIRPERNWWSKYYTGWADYLNIDNSYHMLRRGNALKGKTPLEAAYTVTVADLPCIRKGKPARIYGKLSAGERVGLDQRPLTLAELAKLQGFPEAFNFTGNTEQIRKQIGNAWHVNVARALAIKAKETLTRLDTWLHYGH